MIQCQTFRDCTPQITGTKGRLTKAQITTLIHNARQTALGWTQDAASVMQDIKAGKGSAIAKAHLAKHFGTPSSAQINTITSRFNKIKVRLPMDKRLICNTAKSHYCKKGWCAYQDCPGPNYPTHLCPKYIADSFPCGATRAATLIHEAAHAYGACGDTAEGAGYPPANAHNNAPSYENFAASVSLRKPTLGPPKRKPPRSPSLIDDIIRDQPERFRQRILESVKEL